MKKRRYIEYTVERILKYNFHAFKDAKDKELQAALEEIMDRRTSFVIAQRVSTVLNADKILVLEDGQIVAEGSHRELLESSPIYREIYDSQLGNGVTTHG